MFFSSLLITIMCANYFLFTLITADSCYRVARNLTLMTETKLFLIRAKVLSIILCVGDIVKNDDIDTFAWFVQQKGGSLGLLGGFSGIKKKVLMGDEFLNLSISDTEPDLNSTIVETRGTRTRSNITDDIKPLSKAQRRKLNKSKEKMADLQPTEDSQVVHVSFGHKNYPETNLEEESFSKIVTFISEARAKTSPGKVAKIKIKRMYIKDGKLDVICVDRVTAEWVRSLDVKKLSDPQIILISEDLVRCSIRILTRSKEYSVQEFKNQLMFSNPGLMIKNLVFFDSRSFNKTESLIYFGVDREAYNYLQIIDYKVYFDCSYTEIRSEERRNEQSKKKVKLTHVK